MIQQLIGQTLSESEFFFCSTNFDSKRPNESGLSITDLHTFLKSADAELVVKVIDACSSGAPLIKADNLFMPSDKGGFRNLIQISSCLDSQNSLTGNPLSLFTDRFRTAVLRKTDGIVYYTDIIDTLRDDFLENSTQTPYFVSQGTGREAFVEDAKRFDQVRAMLKSQTTPEDAHTVQVIPVEPPLPHLLEAAERKVATSEVAQKFVANLFDQILKQVPTGEFANVYNMETVEHPNFNEPTTKGFIIRVLTGETRPDNFVTATITRSRKHDPFNLARLAGLFAEYGEISETLDLRLNCSMQRVQLKIMLTPKYMSLKRLILVVTCAPSLEHCYIFEMVTQHSLKDWGQFDSDGIELTRRWYKFTWSDDASEVAAKISQTLHDGIRKYLEVTANRLVKD